MLKVLFKTVGRVLLKLFAPLFPHGTDDAIVIGVPLAVLVVGGLLLFSLLERSGSSSRKKSAATKGRDPSLSGARADEGPSRVPSPAAGHVVRVELTDIETGVEETSVLRLELPSDLDAITPEMCTVDSPMGRALVGAERGSVIEFQTNTGPRRLRVGHVSSPSPG